MEPIVAIAAGLLVALAYFPMASRRPSWLRSTLKTLPLLCFAYAAYLSYVPAFLALALFLSALGDFALSRYGRKAFLYGLSAFALAHLVYIILFLNMANTALWEAFAIAPIAAVAMLIFAFSTELWLTPHTGKLRWPVRVYIGLITAMGLAVLTLPLEARFYIAEGEEIVLHLPHAMVVLGAALFIISDLILSIRMFRMQDGSPRKHYASWGVWLFYILGQMLILGGLIA